MSLRLLWLGWILAAPLVALVTALHPRTRETWRARWALDLPAVAPGAVWVHASSVGEGSAAAAVCEALRRHPARPVLLRTASTDTGLATARGHHVLAPRPVDAPWVVARWLDRVRPRLLVLVEGDLWPCLMSACRQREIPIVVVGLRAGRGLQRLRRLLPVLFRDMAAAVSLWLVREPVPGLPGAVERVGELKGLPAGLAPVPLPAGTLVAGSTRPGDEVRLLDAWTDLDPRPLLVLAPRHPERFAAVADLLAARGLRAQRWSRGGAVEPEAEVVLVDTVGELARFYPRAAAAFVGGTFDQAIGGHSPAEPAAAGLPLVAGPERAANGPAWVGLALHEAPRPEALGPALAAALAEGPGVAAQTDGPARVAQRLGPFLAGPVPLERTLRPWLGPLVPLYRLLATGRTALRRTRAATLPVISVGGLGSGGAGKTPVVAALAERLEARGHPVAVVARGHLRDPGGPPLRTGGGAAALGDELAMLGARGLAVISSPDRVAGAAEAAGAGAEVVLLDDGFQHRRLARSADVVVVDPRWPSEGGVLPAGEAREGLSALTRADLLWLSGPGELRGAPEGLPRVRSRLVPTGWRHGGAQLPLDQGPPGPLAAFAGIHRPGRFLAELVALGLDVRRWQAFADHRRWTLQEQADLVDWGVGCSLVCTEKDRVRLPETFDVWVLTVACELLHGEAALEQLLDRVMA